MTAHRLAPQQLVDFPELAALALLDTALGIALDALLVVYPRVASPDFATEPPGPTALACLADSMATQADALLTMLARYRDLAAHQEEFEEIRRALTRTVARQPDDDIPF